jgi:hypothetical protein
MPFDRYTKETNPMQLNPVLGLSPVAVYGYPKYLRAVATIAAPVTEFGFATPAEVCVLYVGVDVYVPVVDVLPVREVPVVTFLEL